VGLGIRESLGGGRFNYNFIFHPDPWQDDPKIDEHMFANGWNETTNLHLIISEWSEISLKTSISHPTAPLRQVGQPANIYTTVYLGGGFKHFLFSPLFGEDFHFD